MSGTPHELVAAHMELSRKCNEAVEKRNEWTRKCQALIEAGDLEAARKALKKADWWEFRRKKCDLQRRALEPRHPVTRG